MATFAADMPVRSRRIARSGLLWDGWVVCQRGGGPLAGGAWRADVHACPRGPAGGPRALHQPQAGLHAGRAQAARGPRRAPARPARRVRRQRVY